MPNETITQPKNDDETKEMLLEFRRTCEIGSAGTYRRMSKCERFRIGEQWDHNITRRNKFLAKHTLTINRIHPTILQVAGQQVQNPRDLRVVFSKSRARVRANLLTALAKHTMDTSYSHNVTSFGFENGATTGRGWLGVDVVYDDDPARGDLIVNQHDPFMVGIDPSCKCYDLNHPINGAKYVYVDEWIDKDKLEAEYPKKKDQLRDVSYHNETGSSYFGRLTARLFRGSNSSGGCANDYRTCDYDRNIDDVTFEGNETDQFKYKYRRTTYWWRLYKRAVYLQRLDEPLEFHMYWKKKDIAAAKLVAEQNPEEVRLIDNDREGKPLTVPILHKTVMVGDVLLKDIEDPFDGVMLIPLARFAPYFVNGYEFGVVQNIIGPQEQLNWSRSMFLNIWKKVANTGWIVGKILTHRLKEKLKNEGSEDGAILSKADYGTLDRIDQSPPDQTMLLSAAQAEQDIAQTSNVRLESPQTDKDRVASAIRLKQASAFTGSAAMFANWDFTFMLLGQILVEHIRLNGNYTVEEIEAIVDEEDLIDPQLLAEARQLVVQDFEQQGINLEPPEPPDIQGISRSFERIAQRQQQPQGGQEGEAGEQQQQQNFDLDNQKEGLMQAQLESYEQELQAYQQINAEIDKIAMQMAREMLFDEIEKAHEGKLALKVSMAPMAESMRVIKWLEQKELHETLVTTGIPGLSRRSLIEAADPPNKEAILAEGVSAPAVAQTVQGNQ